MSVYEKIQDEWEMAVNQSEHLGGPSQISSELPEIDEGNIQDNVPAYLIELYDEVRGIHSALLRLNHKIGAPRARVQGLASTVKVIEEAPPNADTIYAVNKFLIDKLLPFCEENYSAMKEIVLDIHQIGKKIEENITS